MEYSLPVEIAVDILGVFNVADVPVNPRPNVVKGPDPPANMDRPASSSSGGGTIIPNYVTPALLNKVYSIDSNIGSTLVSQGVYETSSQTYSPSDLTAFQNSVGIPKQSVAVDIGGHQSDTYCLQYNSNCYEGNLDVQYMMGVSQVTPMTYYYIDESNFILNWLQVMASTPSPPLVLSVSWGLADYYLSKSYMDAVNTEAIILSTMGVTLVASSGDNGVNDNAIPCGAYYPQFPASSPYFTAVGATNVLFLWQSILSICFLIIGYCIVILGSSIRTSRSYMPE